MERVYTTPLLDKLGIRPAARVALVGRVADALPGLLTLLAERTPNVTDESDGTPAADTDVILLAADSTAELDGLAALAGRIVPAGAIWVVSRKGRGSTLRDVEVMAVARSAGLVDNKVVAFSTTHTAIRLVIPVARRPPRGTIAR
jgi:hypothetical protein